MYVSISLHFDVAAYCETPFYSLIQRHVWLEVKLVHKSSTVHYKYCLLKFKDKYANKYSSIWHSAMENCIFPHETILWTFFFLAQVDPFFHITCGLRTLMILDIYQHVMRKSLAWELPYGEKTFSNEAIKIRHILKIWSKTTLFIFKKIYQSNIHHKMHKKSNKHYQLFMILIF